VTAWQPGPSGPPTVTSARNYPLWRHSLSSLRTLTCGGSPVLAALIAACRKRGLASSKATG
jgi:hypothetical protein